MHFSKAGFVNLSLPFLVNDISKTIGAPMISVSFHSILETNWCLILAILYHVGLLYVFKVKWITFVKKCCKNCLLLTCSDLILIMLHDATMLRVKLVPRKSAFQKKKTNKIKEDKNKGNFQYIYIYSIYC